ncbi:hypothetical protein H072_6188 [Dactylellina haptotyla CBS 200.50]|uniref:Uncharacterized protein n=1 Tax=Dactylellina haptotyla (strain CBS 200.50) TaxID=1284197 RepID=S8BKT9_DACHA|nr:hypothetical protein H072_6188 [Dactylellina haptotyla CBS 200.50]
MMHMFNKTVVTVLLGSAGVGQAFLLGFQLADQPELSLTAYPYANRFADPVELSDCEPGPGHENVLAVGVINGVAQNIKANRDQQMYGIALWRTEDCIGEPDLIIKWRHGIQGMQIASLVASNLVMPVGSWLDLEEENQILQTMDPPGSILSVPQNEVIYYENHEWVVVSGENSDAQNAVLSLMERAADIRNLYNSPRNIMDMPPNILGDFPAYETANNVLSDTIPIPTQSREQHPPGVVHSPIETPRNLKQNQLIAHQTIAEIMHELGRLQPMARIEDIEQQSILLQGYLAAADSSNLHDLIESWRRFIQNGGRPESPEEHDIVVKEEDVKIEADLENEHSGIVEAAPDDFWQDLAQFADYPAENHSNDNQDYQDPQDYFYNMAVNMFDGRPDAQPRVSPEDQLRISPHLRDIRHHGSPSSERLYRASFAAPPNSEAQTPGLNPVINREYQDIAPNTGIRNIQDYFSGMNLHMWPEQAASQVQTQATSEDGQTWAGQIMEEEPYINEEYTPVSEPPWNPSMNGPGGH